MIRLLTSACFFILLLSGAYWTWETQPFIQNFIKENLQAGEFLTLEIRYSSEHIMEKQKNQLLKNEQYSFMEPSLLFFPYLLMEVKYLKEDNGTGEGFILWDLEDGEMVINTKTWKKTHGYEDCIISKANRYDFKIINILAKHQGVMDRESLLKNLFVESDILDSWLDSVKEKQLVVQKGNDYRLHFENPLLQNIPKTIMTDRLVSKSYKNTQRIPKKYSISEIRDVAKVAFGNGFAIRKTTEVYLPVHNIEIKNPDGSIFSTQWNAITGNLIHDSFFP